MKINQKYFLKLKYKLQLDYNIVILYILYKPQQLMEKNLYFVQLSLHCTFIATYFYNEFHRKI